VCASFFFSFKCSLLPAHRAAARSPAHSHKRFIIIVAAAAAIKESLLKKRAKFNFIQIYFESQFMLPIKLERSHRQRLLLFFSSFLPPRDYHRYGREGEMKVS
jgi:hypothetical protein